MRGVEGGKGVEGADVAAIYTYSHMVRAPLGIGYICSFMGPRSKMSEWVIPLRLEHLRC